MNTRALLLALPLAALVGCTADNNASIQVFGMCGPPDDAKACTTDGTCDTIFAQRPAAFVNTTVLDPVLVGTTMTFVPRAVNNSFDMFIQLNNQLPKNDDEDVGRVNTNDFTLRGYKLRFSSSPPIALPDYTWNDTMAVPANGSATPLVALIPLEIMEAIDDFNPPVPTGFNPPITVGFAVVDVEVTFFGDLADGRRIDVAPFHVFVDVFDAQAGFPVCDDPTQSVVGICPHSGQSASVACE